jgi:hypothetical protein
LEIANNSIRVFLQARINISYSLIISSVRRIAISSILADLIVGIKYLLLNGYSATQQALAGGQYYDDSGIASLILHCFKFICLGLFYGGSELQQSYDIILDFFCKNLMIGIEHFIHIDVHTGLGKSGHDSLITSQDNTEWGKLQGTSFCVLYR